LHHKKEDDAMETTMTPSQQMITDDQIYKAGELFKSILKRHRSELPSEAVQQVLGNNEVWPEVFASFRKRVDAVSNMIIKRVKVDRSRTPKQALDATDRAQYTNSDVVETMPKGEGEEVDVYFFKPDLSARGGHISDDDLEKEFELRGLKPVDPYSLAQVNTDDSAFADERPNGTHWKDENGKWCFATFSRWYGERRVFVDRNARGWLDHWWFAGVRK
jgi:hypothetical protein